MFAFWAGRVLFGARGAYGESGRRSGVCEVKEVRYLGAREAAGELGVTLPTLYAYVSRGLIRSEAAGGRSATGATGRRTCGGSRSGPSSAETQARPRRALSIGGRR